MPTSQSNLGAGERQKVVIACGRTESKAMKSRTPPQFGAQPIPPAMANSHAQSTPAPLHRLCRSPSGRWRRRQHRLWQHRVARRVPARAGGRTDRAGPEAAPRMLQLPRAARHARQGQLVVRDVGLAAATTTMHASLRGLGCGSTHDQHDTNRYRGRATQTIHWTIGGMEAGG